MVDEASRRKRQRLLTAGGIAVAVAAALVFLIEKFYDPEAWARAQAIEQEVARMAEQQKVTDDLTRIEIDIEDAITKNDLVTARAELARLIEQAPDHPRREFLQTSIDRAAELQKLAGQSPPPAPPAAARPRNTATRATRAIESAGARGRTRARTKRPAAFRTRHLPAGFEAAYLWRANQRAAARIHDRAGCADQCAAHDHQHDPAREELQRENGRSQ